MTTVNAALTDIAPAPMANTASAVVKPNLMFVLDGSGSMDRDYMPDSVSDDPACKDDDATLRTCSFADPAYNAALFNGMYYNPAITYTPAVNYDGTSRTSYTTWTAVPNDAYGVQFSGNIDLDGGLSGYGLVQHQLPFSDRPHPAVLQRRVQTAHRGRCVDLSERDI